MEKRNSPFYPERSGKPPEGPKTVESEAVESEAVESEASWLELLKDRFNSFFRKERKKSWPEVTIDIFFSAHVTKEDFERLARKVSESDIYIPELAGWDEEDAKHYRNVASGRESPQEALQRISSERPINYPEAVLRTLEILHGSKKPVVFIDLPHGHPLRILRRELSKLGDYEVRALFQSDFPQALAITKARLERLAEWDKKREQYMLSQLELKISDVLRREPSLRKKQKLRVLLSLGAMHTPLYFDLRKKGLKAERSFSSSPFVFPFTGEVIRRFEFGRDVSNDLLARAFLENLFFPSYNRFLGRTSGGDTQKRIQLARNIISRFNFEEVGNIFSALQEGRRFEDVFSEHLRAKGVNLPQSEKELDQFLAQTRV